MTAVVAPLATAVLVVTLGWRWRPRPVRLADLAVEHAPNGRRRAAGRRRLAIPRRSRRHQRPDPADVGEWCGRVSASCRSGATLSAALRTAEPPNTASDVVDEVRLALERGSSLVEAIDAHSPGEHLDVALTAVRACASSGAPAAEPLDRAAAALRGRAAEAADRATHSAQARLSAVVMTFLPAAMLLVLLATSDAVRSVATTPVGVASIIAGAVLNAAGWRWMRRIIERAAR